ncbi:hypothetical protein PHMEG_00032035 [Phytophthora megakarya]|uniref:Uncharacterized protein n=1 Tax=Phytophthora megakarya TaxID=4795 RepID=A0A225UWD9_9STRA|nr:hypothetical protein PHMEG_00032035 [Phytophthora megakarya]
MTAQTTSANLPNTPTETSVPAAATREASDIRRMRTITMDSKLTPWELYDLSTALQTDTPDTMRDHFRRFCASREKPIEGAGHTALQRSWCAFIRRWNRMTLEV